MFSQVYQVARSRTTRRSSHRLHGFHKVKLLFFLFCEYVKSVADLRLDFMGSWAHLERAGGEHKSRAFVFFDQTYILSVSSLECPTGVTTAGESMSTFMSGPNMEISREFPFAKSTTSKHSLGGRKIFASHDFGEL